MQHANPWRIIPFLPNNGHVIDMSSQSVTNCSNTDIKYRLFINTIPMSTGALSTHLWFCIALQKPFHSCNGWKDFLYSLHMLGGVLKTPLVHDRETTSRLNYLLKWSPLFCGSICVWHFSRGFLFNWFLPVVCMFEELILVNSPK
jgi:hypothetical protein